MGTQQVHLWRMTRQCPKKIDGLSSEARQQVNPVRNLWL